MPWMLELVASGGREAVGATEEGGREDERRKEPRREESEDRELGSSSIDVAGAKPDGWIGG